MQQNYSSPVRFEPLLFLCENVSSVNSFNAISIPTRASMMCVFLIAPGGAGGAGKSGSAVSGGSGGGGGATVVSIFPTIFLPKKIYVRTTATGASPRITVTIERDATSTNALVGGDVGSAGAVGSDAPAAAGGAGGPASATLFPLDKMGITQRLAGGAGRNATDEANGTSALFSGTSLTIGGPSGGTFTAPSTVYTGGGFTGLDWLPTLSSSATAGGASGLDGYFMLPDGYLPMVNTPSTAGGGGIPIGGNGGAGGNVSGIGCGGSGGGTSTATGGAAGPGGKGLIMIQFW